MATQVQLRRGTAAQNDVFTGAIGEVTVDTDNDTLRVHDGGTAGGFPLIGEKGGTLTGNLSFGDNDKAIFGAGSDLQIYHDGASSYVSDQGTGGLFLLSDNIVNIQNAAGTEQKARFISNGAVELYYDNALKLATTSTGIDVTGQVDVNSAARIDSSGVVKSANGSAADPTHSFLNDPDNGMFRPTTNTVGFSTAGTEAMRIDSSQRVLIGHTSALTQYGSSSNLQILGTNFNGSTITARRDSNDGNPAGFIFAKSRGSIGGNTIIQDGDTIGSLLYAGADGNNVTYLAARIDAAIDSTPGAGDMPGRLVFYTTADGAVSPTERMRIDNAGKVLINNAAITTGFGTNKGPLQVGTNQGSPYYWTDINTGANQYASMPNEIAVLNTPNALQNSYAGIFFQPGESSDGSAISAARIGAVRETAGNIDTALVFANRNGSSMAEAMRIDSSRRVLIGLTSDIGTGHKLQLNNDATIMTFDGTTTGANGIRFIKSRASSPGSNAIIADDDDVGFLDFRVDDGTDYGSRTGVIASAVDGTPGANDTPGRLEFYTTADGASSATERMRIDNSGTLLVGKTATGLSNAGTQINADGRVMFTRDGFQVLDINRKTSDGDIVKFYKDGTTCGVIENRGGTINVITDPNTSGGQIGAGIGGTNGAILPCNASGIADNAIDMGTPSFRWDDIYATNGTIQTSDRNEKQDIEELSDAEQRVAVAAKGLLRKYRWKDAVAEKGDEARIHFGIIAQDLQAAFEAEGLDAGRYGMFISSTWTDEETGEERTRMGVRYPQLLAFIIAAL